MPEINVTATVNHSGASYVMKLGGVIDADGVIPLAMGSNSITIEVTAEDSVTTRIYTVIVTRDDTPVPPPITHPSSDAALSALTLSGIDIGTFDSATTSYSAQVANDLAQTTVTPTVNHSRASYVIKFKGVIDDDGVIPLPLVLEGDDISIEVTAEDGSTSQAYTVTVTRASSTDTGDTPSADFSGDGVLDLTDFSLFLHVYGKRAGDAGFDARMDLDDSGEVGVRDFFIFVSLFKGPSADK